MKTKILILILAAACVGCRHDRSCSCRACRVESQKQTNTAPHWGHWPKRVQVERL